MNKMDSILANEKWYWKTIGIFNRFRFIEKDTGYFIKNYNNKFTISIDIDNYSIDYGENSYLQYKSPSKILKHKDIVILDCVDKLLRKGYDREDIVIIADAKSDEIPNILLMNQSGTHYVAFNCYRWGEKFENALSNFKKKIGSLFNYYEKNIKTRYLCIYSSYLDGGLPYKTYSLYDMSNYDREKILFHAGIFESDIKQYEITPLCSEDEKKKTIKKIKIKLSKYPQIDDFSVRNGVIIEYKGNEQEITIPNPITQIGMGAFWDCTFLKSIILNDGIMRIGGDAFYKCINLENLNIPSTVREIGNDPFAGCPSVSLENDSEHFILEDGVLYNRKKTQILHYPIKKQLKHFEIPSSVRYINKHTFYDNIHLRSIVIPKRVIWIENNIFSGCKVGKVVNESPYFCIDNGVLYNKNKSQVYSVFNHKLKKLVLPDNVQKIGKNSFYWCKNLEYLQISKNVTHIGYNPFVGCSKLELTNESSDFTIENGMLINKKLKLLKFCPNSCVDDTIEIPDYIKIIGRNSFSFCINLKTLRIPNSVKLIERGSFGGCSNLSEIKIPDSVEKIEKWAFSHCKKLSKVHISKDTKLEEYIFTESPTILIRT
ncbi:MAG: leucine-rich repeat protein [Candidatus Lokiarchaeota archaeon]|nr:leucine-rich repeat protein [Candidatus Lokiarchaeota archaeon]